MRAVNEGGAIVIPCNRGVDQSAHPRLSPPGTFEIVQNMRIKGAGLLEKRPGTRGIGSVSLDSVTPAFTESASSRVPSFVATDGNLGFVGASDGVAYAHQEVDDSLIPIGRFPTCQPIRKRSGPMGSQDSLTVGIGFGMKPTAVAVNSAGYLLIASLDNEDRMLAYIETPEGARIYTKLTNTLRTIERVRAVAQGSALILVWMEDVSGDHRLYAQTFTVSSGDVTASAETALQTGLAATSYIDACPGPSCWFAVWQVAGSPNIPVNYSKYNLLTHQANNTFTTTELVVPCVYASDSYLWVAWYESTSSLLSKFLVASTTDLATVLAASNGAGGGAGGGPMLLGPGATDSVASYVARVQSGSRQVAVTGVVGIASGTTGTTGISGVVPISRPDRGARFWAVACQNSTNCTIARVVLLGFVNSVTRGFSVVELSLDEMPFTGLAGLGINDPSYFSAPGVGEDRVYFAAPVVVATVGDQNLTRVDVLQYSSSVAPSAASFETEAHRATALDPGLLVVAGQPCELHAQPFGIFGNGYDSYFGSAEIGFISAPTIFSLSASAGVIGAGTYTYIAVREWADARGRRHQSSPSEPVTITLTTSGQVTIAHDESDREQPGMRTNLLGRILQPWTVFYRTTNGGTEFQRVPGVATDDTNFTDATTDANLADEAFVYTAGNVLANTLAPSCRSMRYAAGRLWCGGMWDEDMLEASKVIVPEEQPAFTNDATHRVSIGGPCKGLAVMDDQLVAFLEDGIVAIGGDGPNDQGIGSFVVRTVSSGIGCIDERSVLETDIGIFFRSRLGFMLLPRGFGPPQYVGAAIRSTAEDFPTTLGASVWHGNGVHLARFLVDNAETTRTLSYELNSGQWFVDTFPRRMTEIGVWPEGFVLCGEILDTTDPLNLALANQPIWIEDPDEIADGVWSSSTGHHIEQRIRTNWIAPTGPGGWCDMPQSLFALLASAPASVTLQIEVDSSGASHSNTWTLSASDDVTYRYLVPLERHGVAFRLSAWDGEVSSEPAAGVRFIAISTEQSPDGGLRPPDTGERV